MPLDLIKIHFSKAISWPLGDLTKNIVCDRNIIYKLRGAFMHGAKRCGLRAAMDTDTTCALRSHEK